MDLEKTKEFAQVLDNEYHDWYRKALNTCKVMNGANSGRQVTYTAEVPEIRYRGVLACFTVKNHGVRAEIIPLNHLGFPTTPMISLPVGNILSFDSEPLLEKESPHPIGQGRTVPSRFPNFLRGRKPGADFTV